MAVEAIGGAIHHIGNIHKYARPEDVPAHTLFFITTDGMENASRNYTSQRVKEMIRRQEEKYGWEFLFVAANIDAVETAQNLGIRRDCAANYEQTGEGTGNMYACVSSLVSSVRREEKIDEDWAKVLGKKQKTKK